ncbi:MAG: glycosyltransferase [Paludibacteraceae bacterium]|nr:glycosyltransferase [Paludibacteraceae bacterium]
MKLSIITINYNNAAGLKKTLDSVAAQRIHPQPFLQKDGSDMYEIEHIIVDGGSTDGSVDVIKEYESCIAHSQLSISLKWVSEKDKGIYNAMNKGIEIAMGRRVVGDDHRSELVDGNSNLSSLNSNLPQDHYLQILNSSDCLATEDVLSRMMGLLDEDTDILLANIIHVWPNGRLGRSIKKQKDSTAPQVVKPTLLNFYHGTIPHDAALIRKSVYETYGYYDEEMKICSDWKLFLHAMVIGLGGVEPLTSGRVKYVDIDMVLFDMTGTSNQNTDKWQVEKRPELEGCVPARILADYDAYYQDICLMQRIHRHQWAYRLVWFVERVLFKIEKWFR